MTIKTITCFELTCDTCDDPWSEDGTPHFPSVQEAIAAATGRGWVITKTSMRCDECARTADCEITGHQPGDWTDVRDPRLIPHRARWCDHCGAAEYDPPAGEIAMFYRAERDFT